MTLNVYQWMLLNCDKLVAAVKEDGGIGGPKSEPLLEEAWKLQTPGKTKAEARKLFHLRLKIAGLEKLIPGE